MSISVTQSEVIGLETPAERRRRRVRDAIIDAAERVFAKEGPEGLSIRRLAEEIDYSPSAIYKYFASKTELVTTLKEAFFEGLIDKIEEVKARPDLSLSECVRESIATYVRAALLRPHHYAAAFSGLGVEIDFEDLKECEPEGCSTFREKAFLMLHELVVECVDSGLFRQDIQIGPATKSLWASMHGLAMLMIHLPGYGSSFFDGETMDQAEFIRYHSDLVARGLEA